MPVWLCGYHETEGWHFVRCDVADINAPTVAESEKIAQTWLRLEQEHPNRQWALRESLIR